MTSKYNELVQILREEKQKYGWGCILVVPDKFKEFLELTRPRIHLDVGCCTGLLKGFVEQHSNAEYIGLDVYNYGTKIDIIASGDLLPLRDNSVDTVSYIETLEHIPFYPSSLRQVFRIARKGVFIQSVICNDPCALKDRTHLHVLHPETLSKLPKYIGFRKVVYGVIKGTFWLWGLK